MIWASRIATVVQWALLLFAGVNVGRLSIPETTAGPADYALWAFPGYIAAAIAGVRSGSRLIKSTLPPGSDEAAPQKFTIRTEDLSLTVTMKGGQAADAEGREKLGTLLKHLSERRGNARGQ